MEADTVVLIVTIVGSVFGSTLTTISLLLKQISRLDNKFDVPSRLRPGPHCCAPNTKRRHHGAARTLCRRPRGWWYLYA